MIANNCVRQYDSPLLLKGKNICSSQLSGEVISGCFFKTYGPDNNTSNNHQSWEDLAHGDKSHEKTDVLVRFSKYFDKHAKQSVKDKKESQ